MRAVVCPVCKGDGKYKGDRCHGCNGKGWVQVLEDRPVMRPFLDPPREPYKPGRPPAHSYLGR